MSIIEPDMTTIVRPNAGEAHKLAVRALLEAEWGGMCMSYGEHCPVCGSYSNDPSSDKQGRTHEPGCELDAALCAAGLPDQATRDVERSGHSVEEQRNCSHPDAYPVSERLPETGRREMWCPDCGARWPE